MTKHFRSYFSSLENGNCRCKFAQQKKIGFGNNLSSKLDKQCNAHNLNKLYQSIL
jgi:hypothetical protein